MRRVWHASSSISRTYSKKTQSKWICRIINRMSDLDRWECYPIEKMGTFKRLKQLFVVITKTIYFKRHIYWVFMLTLIFVCHVQTLNLIASDQRLPPTHTRSALQLSSISLFYIQQLVSCLICRQRTLVSLVLWLTIKYQSQEHWDEFCNWHRICILQRVEQCVHTASMSNASDTNVSDIVATSISNVIE